VERSAHVRRTVLNTIIYGMLILWALIVLFPFYWMILTSVKTYASYNAEHIPQFFTLSPTLANYVQAFTAVPLGKYFLNTVIFTLGTTAIMLIVAIPAAFAFARMDFRGKVLSSHCFWR
jgi:multiple sugar transport system permease protein